MDETILYQVHKNLYVNLTNRCPCACTFCLRQTRDRMDESGSLWLDHEPSAEEVIEALKKKDLSRYEEVVFCGFGEPTEQLDVLLEVAAYIKEHTDKKIRINTNGLGNLIHGRNITPDMKGLVDVISISLNTPNKQKYHELVRSRFGEKSYDAMLEFAGEAKKYVPTVILSTVETTISRQEEQECQAICDRLGVTYRIRPFE
ncbi:MAG: TIGR04100 family radical SAM protein [Lachnospiraceae bacterium]|nr:TIGR04100 family radical SAM protein [Lachnospiraceae bacterium]